MVAKLLDTIIARKTMCCGVEYYFLGDTISVQPMLRFWLPGCILKPSWYVTKRSEFCVE